jgi:hypothetical protein
MPAASRSLTCTKTSGPPSSGRMKLNPRSVLKNLTRPVGIQLPIQSDPSHRKRPTPFPRRAGTCQQHRFGGLLNDRAILPRKLDLLPRDFRCTTRPSWLECSKLAVASQGVSGSVHGQPVLCPYWARSASCVSNRSLSVTCEQGHRSAAARRETRP